MGWRDWSTTCTQLLTCSFATWDVSSHINFSEASDSSSNKTASCAVTFKALGSIAEKQQWCTGAGRTVHGDLMLCSHWKHGKAIIATANCTENINRSRQWSSKALKHVLNFKSSLLPGLSLLHRKGTAEIPSKESGVHYSYKQQGGPAGRWSGQTSRTVSKLFCRLQMPHPEEELIGNRQPVQQIKWTQMSTVTTGRKVSNWHRELAGVVK